jgi:hypothetical protein
MPNSKSKILKFSPRKDNPALVQPADRAPAEVKSIEDLLLKVMGQHTPDQAALLDVLRAESAKKEEK